MVAVDDVAQMIGKDDPVGIPVEGYAHVGSVLLHQPDHVLRMSRAAVLVDIASVRRGCGADQLHAQFLENERCDVICRPVGAIQNGAYAVE